jgi:two-component system nitrogen regulation response regulator GlnG
MARDKTLPPGDGGLATSVEKHLNHYLTAYQGGLPARGLYRRIIREVERPLIALSLDATGGNQLRAAALLGLNRNTLRKRIRELDIAVSREPRNQD